MERFLQEGLSIKDINITKLDEMLVKIAISVVIVILNYIISKVFVFKNRKEI